MCMPVAFMFAVAVVQANPCSSGSECPGSSKPQNVVSLLQTKLHMNMLEDGQLTIKDPSAMLTELEGMVRSGETPTFDLVSSIKDIIENQIMPGLRDTQDAAAQDTVDALSVIDSCHNQSKVNEGKIQEEEEVAVSTARSEHAACRQAEEGLFDHNLTDSDSYCVKLGEFLNAATALEIPAGSARDGSFQYVKAACGKNMCNNPKVTDLDNGCSAQESLLADKKAECLIKQGTFERAFCTWKIVLEANCKELNTCHSVAVTAYNTHVAKRQTLVAKWNVETAALKKIHCHCSVWMSGTDDGANGDGRSKHNATQFEVCKNQTHTADPVNYGTPATKVPCLLTSVAEYPGTSDFITQEYSSFINFAETAVPCAEPTLATYAPKLMTAAPTTVAP